MTQSSPALDSDSNITKPIAESFHNTHGRPHPGPPSTALVAGGAGFIGRWLVQRLCEEGTRVTVLDTLETSPGGDKRLDERAEFVQEDICDPTRVWPHADLVVNLAARASPKAYFAEPLRTLRSGSVGSENLLVHASTCGSRYVYASTSEVYGDPLEHPQSETYSGNVNPIGPRSVYDESKRFGEALTAAYARAGVDARIVRIFNTYGPGMQVDDGRIIPNFFRAAISGQPLSVYGSGRQTRSLCFVSDLVEGLWRVATAETYAGPYNLGNPQEHSVATIAAMVAEQCGRAPDNVTYTKALDEDPQRRCPDISRAVRDLDWQPSVSLVEGLARCHAYFHDQISSGASAAQHEAVHAF